MFARIPVADDCVFSGELSIHPFEIPPKLFVFHSAASEFSESIVIKCDVISNVFAEGDVEI
jgi:hypothetical protein